MEQTQELVDVDRLVDDLRERAERERRDGPGIDTETPTARVVTAATRKTTPYVMSILSRWQRSYGRLSDAHGKDVLRGDHGFFHTIGSC